MSAITMVASVPEPTPLAEELLDQIVAFRPIREEEIETPMGTSVATFAHVVAVDTEGRTQDRGELPIFWLIVRAQLRKASPEVPWIAGVLARPGKAYRLRPLTAEQNRLVEQAIAGLPH